MFLTTDRLLLRDFVEDDWRAVLAYQRDPRYLRFYEWADRSEEEVQKFVQVFLDQQRESPRNKFQVAIILRAENRLIGNCGLRRETETEGSLGYELDPDYWSHGYATEAARETLRFGFEELKLHRVSSWCIAENVASAHALEKLGMKREGHLRERNFFKGEWWDELVYAILEEEWRRMNNETIISHA